MLEDRIRTVVDYDKDTITVTASLIIHKNVEIDVDMLDKSSIDLISAAKEQTKRELMEVLNDLRE